MENRQVEALLAAQRGFFRTGATLPRWNTAFRR